MIQCTPVHHTSMNTLSAMRVVSLVHRIPEVASHPSSDIVRPGVLLDLCVTCRVR